MRRCFGTRSGSRPTTAAAATPPMISPATTGNNQPSTDEDHRNHRYQSPSSSSSAANSPSLTTINLRQEYIDAVKTNSCNEIRSRLLLHRHQSDPSLVHIVLDPDPSSVRETLASSVPTPLTRYLDSTESASALFLSLRRSLDLAASIYSPLADLLDLVSADEPVVSRSQCDLAFDAFQKFDQAPNPFPAVSFDGIRGCFLELKQHLDSRLAGAQRERRALRSATRVPAYCLLVTAAAAAVAGLAIATHALVALAAAGPAAAFCCGGDPLEKRRRRLRECIARSDAAGREAFVLGGHLDTIESLVARLRENVESDRELVRLVLERERGKGERLLVQEVLSRLRTNYSSFMHRLRFLDDQIVLCLAAVNRARALLVQQIHC